ncbi:MAG: hypothetical protein JWR35_2508 [Marmoricola sp.]|nr:hypothetical protein [Marmoricola sp.]
MSAPGGAVAPRVSVIMAAFNCVDTVAEAVESIVAQTFEDWELVVCDDCSTDGTHELLRGLAAEHGDRFVLLRNEENSHLSFSLNRCLAVARGELVARMDADDVSLPKRLETQVAFLDEHSDADLVGTAVRRFDASGPADIVRVPDAPDRFALRDGVPFCHATILTYRSVYEALGGYTVSPRTTRGQDYDLWFRFYHQGFKGRNLAEPLYLVREDRDAIRRRTFLSRVRLFRTTLIGYALLGYPARWYARPALALLKAFLPGRLMLEYRRYQRWRAPSR